MSPYEMIAATLRDRIYSGEIAVGLPIPSMKQLAREHAVSVSTAQPAVKFAGRLGPGEGRDGPADMVQPRDTESGALSPCRRILAQKIVRQVRPQPLSRKC